MIRVPFAFSKKKKQCFKTLTGYLGIHELIQKKRLEGKRKDVYNACAQGGGQNTGK